MLIFYFWILIWTFSLSINCSVIKSASNVTYCDINTQICEAYLTTVAVLQAPSDQLSFRTLDNAELKVYFDNITVSYVTTATEKASFVDGVLNSYRFRTCPEGWSAFDDEADPYPCQFINVLKDGRVIHKISHRYRYGNNEQNCKCCGDSWVCYAFYIDQPSYYTYYTGFTSQVDKLHFIYKGKPYSVSQLETIELPDMNFTFQTGEAMTFAFENTLILINTATSEYLFRRRDTINSPTEFNERKAGYWRDNNTLLQKIADDKILTGWKPNYWSEGDDVWGISKLSDFEDNNNIDFSISCPNDIVRYTNELKKALILGYSPNAKGAKNIYYDIGVQATTNIQINGFIVQLCVDYPTICICNTLNPLTCLDFEGEIRIRNEVSRNQAKAYLKGNRLYSSDACKDPIFKTSRVPLWIEVIISGANIIPKIDVSQCKPSVFINYDTSVLYLKANCSILPCRINSDTGFTFNFTVSDKEIKIDLESSFQWISVTCLRWTKRYYKDQSEDVTNENGNPTSNNTGSGSSYGGGPSGGLGFLDGILDTITDIGGSILDFILTPLTWIWDFLSAPLEWLLNLWNTIMNNLLFWALMILGGLISLCINGFLFTIILEIVSYQVYKQTTAYTALLTMGGMVVVFKLWQWYRSSKSSATKTQVIKEVEVPLIK